MNFKNFINCPVIINDCRDSNAAGRQQIRATHLFATTPIFIGVSSELEAAGNLIDALDALDGKPGVILANVAPRHGSGKKWENGIPFGYFYFGDTLVVFTINEPILGLIKKVDTTQTINVLDTAAATEQMIQDGFLSPDLKDQIVRSQFRSFDFLPRVAAYLTQTGKKLGQKTNLSSFPDLSNAVWLVDNFGNCKTTLLAEDVSFSPDKLVPTKIGELTCYPRLKDVPNGQSALIIGSSGFREQRFLEIVVQGQNAAEYFDLKTGSKIT